MTVLPGAQRRLVSPCAGEGFDTRVSRESGMLGQGAYFAWAASYSLEGYSRRVRLCLRNGYIRIMTDSWHTLSELR